MIERNKLGQFVKGGNLGNQNAKGNKPNKTSIKKGQHLNSRTEFKKGEMSKKQKGKNNSNWKDGISKASYCIDCGKKLKNYLATRCKKCCKNNLKGKNHWNWQNGKSFEPYGIEFNNKLKEKIRKRDNYICQKCKIKQKKLGYKLSVHHIDYDKQNNNPNNLISLCRKCHMKIHNNINFNL